MCSLINIDKSDTLQVNNNEETINAAYYTNAFYYPANQFQQLMKASSLILFILIKFFFRYPKSLPNINCVFIKEYNNKIELVT